MRKATNAGVTSLGFAAPSGFLNLSTRYSVHTFSALFHANAIQVFTFRVYP